jgi:outer membrane immunogenic protein
MNKSALVIAALLGPLGAAASGAEPFALTTSAGADAGLTVAADDSSFDWSGFYAGIFTGIRAGDTVAPALGVNVGVNAQFDFVLVGGEVSVQGLADPNAAQAYGQILGRAGLVVADDMAVYAAGGYGIELNTAASGDLLLGGGVELGVSDSVSLRAEYLRGFPEQPGGEFQQFSVGAQFHF